MRIVRVGCRSRWICSKQFRAVIADRLVISLINLKQVQPDGFETQPTGAVMMSDATRRVVLAALVQRKREELTHPLLARHIRGELPAYPALAVK